ncbi:MAG: M20/M25/M40 family metallo-hydrolase [Deltaproteobacteria bacterium]|nr:M20/M25/M40 family metallo-hydrolase [Deltaproteobacteria bacterium]
MQTTIQITDQELRETVTYLQHLVSINTTNPPGNEIEACRYIAAIFDKENIPYTILEAAPGRGNIIARLKGDGSKKPLLLSSHLDVVPCENNQWECDPFSGIIKDGCVWGRGTIDMKQMTAMSMALFIKAHKEKLPLKRDLIFAAVADEEEGCHHGSAWLVKHHRDLIAAEYALNEVGGFSLYVGGKRFYPIGVAQRGICWFKMISRGETGHGAMPHNQQALPPLFKAAHRLASQQLPFHRTKVFEDFVYSLAGQLGPLKGFVLKASTKKRLSNFVLNQLFPDKAAAQTFRVMYRNTATPTIIRAGQKTNVIPTDAEVHVDGRILPEQSVASFLKEVRALVGHEVEIEVINKKEPCTVDYSNPFFGGLKEALISADPEGIPVPYLIPGFTDANFYADVGIKTYGFVPTKLPEGVPFRTLFHGHNERIPVEAVHFGVKVLWDVILRSCLT